MAILRDFGAAGIFAGFNGRVRYPRKAEGGGKVGRDGLQGGSHILRDIFNFQM